MNMPGFNAEASLSRTSGHYMAQAGSFTETESVVHAAQFMACSYGPCEKYLCGFDTGPGGLQPIWCYRRQRCCRGCVWTTCGGLSGGLFGG